MNDGFDDIRQCEKYLSRSEYVSLWKNRTYILQGLTTVSRIFNKHIKRLDDLKKYE